MARFHTGCSWCNYSLFSLQKLDSCGFVGVCLLESGDAVIKATKTGFVQLQSHSEELSLVDEFLDFELEDDVFTKLAATWASESKADLVNLLVIDVLADNLERDGQLEIALTLDTLVNSNADWLDGETYEVIIISHAQEATGLPWPVSTVHHFNVSEDDLAFSGLENFFRLGNNLGTLEVPVLAPVPVAAFFTLVLRLPVLELGFDVIEVNFNSHLSKEIADELSKRSFLATLPGFVSSTVESSAATTASASTATVQGNEFRSGYLRLTRNKLITVHLVSVSFFTFDFRKHSDNRQGLLIRSTDLKEWVLMFETLFAHAAVVKVLADTALVAHTIDWCLVATITGSVVHGTFINDGLFFFLQVEVLAREQFIKDLLSLLVKFSFDEVLKSLARDSFSTKGTIFSFLPATLLCFILHLSKHVNLFRLLLDILLNRGLSNRFLSGILALNNKLDGATH